MDATNATSGAEPSRPASGSVTRRAVLLSSGVAVVAAGAGGATFAALQSLTARVHVRPVPLELMGALDAERALIAAVDSAAAADVALAKIMASVRADHVAHEAVLHAAVSAYDPEATASPIPARTASSATHQLSLTRAHLRSLELTASTRAASRALRLSGRDATALASIAAAEASHAELLR